MVNELSKQQAALPIVPVDHTHAPGQSPGQHPDQDQGTKQPPDKQATAPADQHPSAQPDQKRGPSDTSHTPGQAGPSAGHPDVQHYLNLEKQDPNTPPHPAHGGSDAIPLQTTPPTTDHASGTGHVADIRQTTDAAHPGETKHPAETTHPAGSDPADSHRPADSKNPADSKDPGDAKHSADAPHGPMPSAAHAPGAQERTTDTRAAHEVHETPADRALRLHLQPFGVTPEQARDYLRIALVPQLHLNPVTTMRPDDIQRAGKAVSQLPEQQLDHLTAQAKAADAAGHPARQTLDLSHLPAVPRFGFDPPIDRTPSAKEFHLKLFPPEPPKPPILQMPKPAEPSGYAKKMADSAAQGHPSHRVPDVPDAEKVKDATVGDVFRAIQEALGLPKIYPDDDGTLNVERDF